MSNKPRPWEELSEDEQKRIQESVMKTITPEIKKLQEEAAKKEEEKKK